MYWTLEEAQAHFGRLIDASTQEPQMLMQENQPFLAIVKASVFEEFLEWQRSQHSQKKSLDHMLKNLRQICTEENYSLEVSCRQDRSNPFGQD